MKKRAFDRVESAMHINFSYADTMYEGVVTNLSESGMCISTRDCLPHKSKFKILLPLNKEVTYLPARVRRSVRQSGFHDAMGVEIVNPPIQYLEFVRSFRLESRHHLYREKKEVKSYYVCTVCQHIVFEHAPFHCPICYASIENFENNPGVIKQPQDSENLSKMEKQHIPVITIAKDSVTYSGGYNVHIKVGEIEHGMKIENYITFIDVYIQAAYINKRCIGRVGLRCERFQPSVNLYLKDVDSSTLTAISNCSVHGSWISEVTI